MGSEPPLGAVSPASAQASAGRWRVWGAVGLGSATGGGEEGLAALAEIVLQISPHHFAARMLGAGDLYDPATCGMADIGLLYGRTLLGRVGHAALAAGVAATNPLGCGVSGGAARWIIGVPIVAELTVRPLPVLGVGTQGFLNFNADAGFGGLVLFVQLGRLPP